jgi:peptidyl-prolyl cis-trans isomerase B (cyclophilin B)
MSMNQMRTAVAAALVAACVSGALWSAPAQSESGKKPAPPAASVPGLTAENLYNGVNRPAIIHVTSPRSFGTVSLALMSAEGQPLDAPIEVPSGKIDIGEALPKIWTIRRTAYLQMIDGQTPVGSALVLQPMLSRLIPQMREETHPTQGTKYMKIVGWIDENQPRPQATTTPATGATSDQSTAPSENAQRPGEPPKPVERLFTGLRIYAEKDVILHTTKGDIRLAMKPDEAPNTVWNFLELSRGGFYRDIAFHRIVPLTTTGLPFVIQAGDPTATGEGGPGYWLPIEDSHLQHDFGVISMARSDDPDSNGSQIFICLSREGTARLDGQYCAFGYAVDGAQTIKDIASVELADVEAGRPVDPPLIRSAEVVPSPPRIPGRGRPDERVTPQSKPSEPKPTGKIPR